MKILNINNFAKVVILSFISMAFFHFSGSSQENFGRLTGVITNSNNKYIDKAEIKAIHIPSQTEYTTTSLDGGFQFNNLRLGGPYQLTVSKDSFVTQKFTIEDIQLGYNFQMYVLLLWDTNYLKKQHKDSNKKKPKEGASAKADSLIKLKDKIDLKSFDSFLTKITKLDSVVVSNKDTSFLTKQIPFGTIVNKKEILNLPIYNRNLSEIIRLEPSANDNFSVLGQDNRQNNFTIDGVNYNNKFGLYVLPGGQTQSNIISLDAIEDLTVNATPYNLRYSGFTGASINAVTKSGANKFHGTAFVNYRQGDLVGKYGGDNGNTKIPVSNFNNYQAGFTLSGPMKLNKSFYLFNVEYLKNSTPAAGFKENQDPISLGNNIIQLSNFLRNNFNYETGNFTNYSYESQSLNFLLKFDFNVSSKSKVSLKFTGLQSYKDYPNSYSNGSSSGLSFYNSNYRAYSNNYGILLQANSINPNGTRNEFVLGTNVNYDYRLANGTPAPYLNILDNNNQIIIGSGMDPYSLTYNNAKEYASQESGLPTDLFEVRSGNQTFTFNAQMNDNIYFNYKKHAFNLGISAEYTKLVNLFVPNLLGTFTYSSFDSFFSSANSFVNKTIPTAFPYGYSYNYSNLSGRAPWIAMNDIVQAGFWLQDEYLIDKKLKIQFGIRFDLPIILSQYINNPTLLDEKYLYNENGIQVTPFTFNNNPSALLQISPRFSYVYDVNGNKRTFIKGGVGIFNGVTPIVFLSTALTNNGVNFGTESNYGYPIKNRYIDSASFPPPWTPAVNVGNSTPNSSVFVMDKTFTFPQILRANFNVEHHFKQVVFNAEISFSQNLAANFTYNANQIPSVGNFNGADNRPYFGGTNRNPTLAVNPNNYGQNYSNIRLDTQFNQVIILKSAPLGNLFNFKIQFFKPYNNSRWSWLVAYNYLYTQDYTGLQANYSTGWEGVSSVKGNNNPGAGYTDYTNPHRLLGYINYLQPLGKNLALNFQLFGENKFGGRYSYVYGGDMNGDGVYNNDLIYIPNNANETNFIPFTIGGRQVSVQEQQNAFENYISQDPYLKSNRGKYMERNGGLIPQIFRFDLTVKLLIKQNNENRFELRCDIFNLNNLLNPAWGGNYYLNQAVLLNYQGINPQGQPVYTFNPYQGNLNYSSFSKSLTVNDVWQLQFGLRYIF